MVQRIAVEMYNTFDQEKNHQVMLHSAPDDSLWENLK